MLDKGLQATYGSIEVCVCTYISLGVFRPYGVCTWVYMYIHVNPYVYVNLSGAI